MENKARKVFISFRHRDQKMYKEQLLLWNKRRNLFTDKSVDSGEIPDHLEDETIRRKIRDEKLKDTTITLLLHSEGIEKRKFIDWELAGSMIDYKSNDITSYRNAIIVIDLTDRCAFSANNTREENVSNTTGTFTILPSEKRKSRTFWRSQLPYAPDRLIDNLIKEDVQINVIRWSTIAARPEILRELINVVYSSRDNNNYDTSRVLRRRNG